MLTFVKLAIELVGHETVKPSWVAGKTENLMPVYSADGIGFTVVLYAKLELEIQFVKKALYPT